MVPPAGAVALKKTDLNAAVAAAKQWAVSEYLPGLMGGSSISEKQRIALADSMVAFTGLSRQLILDHGMRIDPFTFIRQLLLPQGQIIGLLDSRTTGINAPPVDQQAYRDPSMFVAEAPLTDLINLYVRRELSLSTSLEYVSLSRSVNRSWRWSEPSSQGYPDESDALREAMSRNKNLRVFAAMGY